MNEIKKYIEYTFQAASGINNQILEVQLTDPSEVEIKEFCVGFKFIEEHISINGENRNIDKIIHSNWYYIGERISLEDIKELYRNNIKYRILIGFMEHNHYLFACRTRYGNFIPMSNEDILLEEYLEEQKKLQKLTLN